MIFISYSSRDYNTAQPEPKKSVRGERNAESHKMSRQEELDLQKELERRFDELFGTADED